MLIIRFIEIPNVGYVLGFTFPYIFERIALKDWLKQNPSVKPKLFSWSMVGYSLLGLVVLFVIGILFITLYDILGLPDIANI